MEGHDVQASWAATEIARRLSASPSECMPSLPRGITLSVFATREGRARWPIPDGVLSVELGASPKYSIALEFKRRNEGLHGILTALGQAHAYIKKGHSASCIVIPRTYESHPTPAEYLRDVISNTSPSAPIGIYSYEEPNSEDVSPFRDKIDLVKGIDLGTAAVGTAAQALPTRVQTQWAHLREGSSDASAFFRYLQIAKQLRATGGGYPEPSVRLPTALRNAVSSLQQGVDPLKYLSNSVGDTLHDKIWRHFWFDYVFTARAIPIWKGSGTPRHVLNDAPSELLLAGGASKKFFAGRSDSIKNKLISKLNAGQITKSEAWQQYAQKVRNRAHSYREDVDSGLEHLGFLTEDGRPTSLGYRFVDACERTDDPYSGTARALMGASILKNGGLDAFLHYVFRLSESKFSANALEFSSRSGRGRRFDRTAYLSWLQDELANNLSVMRTVSQRGGVTRQPFQAELAILRAYDFVGGFRVGLGLEINWPGVQEALEVEINSTR